MGKIETVRRFWCKLCDYITYDENVIKHIEKNGGICPACQNGKGGAWFKKHESKYEKTK